MRRLVECWHAQHREHNNLAGKMRKLGGARQFNTGVAH